MRTVRLRRAVRGGVAGVVATAPMSVLMVAAERLGMLPGPPPRLIVDRLAPDLDDRSAAAVTAVTHAAYGAAAGAALALLPVRLTTARGVVLGLGLYVIGYEGWVPMLGVLPPAHRDDRRRVLTMAVAHLVYGAVVGRLARR
jgi:hypothetical protein